MKLSVLLTLNDRHLGDLEKVFASLKDQGHDELVIVLDRTPVVTADFCYEWWKGDNRVKFPILGGEPGWKSPVKAWNEGFRHATGDVLYCLSSETVQAEGNVRKARELLRASEVLSQSNGLSRDGKSEPIRHPGVCLHGKAECSCGPQGQEVNWGGTAPGNLLGDAAHPRPLGFIWAAPAWAVKQIGGYDEAFSEGYWFDDCDVFLRLWRTGLDFLFTDSISGTHLHHDRPVLSTPAGQAGIAHNQAYMLAKHGTLDPWPQLLKMESRKPGETWWRHL